MHTLLAWVISKSQLLLEIISIKNSGNMLELDVTFIIYSKSLKFRKSTAIYDLINDVNYAIFNNDTYTLNF